MTETFRKKIYKYLNWKFSNHSGTIIKILGNWIFLITVDLYLFSSLFDWESSFIVPCLHHKIISEKTIKFGRKLRTPKDLEFDERKQNHKRSADGLEITNFRHNQQLDFFANLITVCELSFRAIWNDEKLTSDLNLISVSAAWKSDYSLLLHVQFWSKRLWRW